MGIQGVILIVAHVDVFVQAFGAVAAATAAVVGVWSRSHLKAVQRETAATSKTSASIEDAVNHRHQHDGSPPRLYDIAVENRRRLNENEISHAVLIEAVHRIEAAVEQHIDWEERQKYAEIERFLKGET